jgi:hypothetical protein
MLAFTGKSFTEKALGGKMNHSPGLWVLTTPYFPIADTNDIHNKVKLPLCLIN